MINITAAFLLLVLVLSETNGAPHLFLPEHMLPPPGITFKLTYDLAMATLRIPSVYFVQPIIDSDLTTVIGYRNWFESEYGATYSVSLTNGTYTKANIDSNTRQCNNALVQTVSCVGWTSVEMIKFDNWCQMRPVDSQMMNYLNMTAISSMDDHKRPVSVTEAMMPSFGSMGGMSLLYQFTSKNEQISFPDVKCYF